MKILFLNEGWASNLPRNPRPRLFDAGNGGPAEERLEGGAQRARGLGRFAFRRIRNSSAAGEDVHPGCSLTKVLQGLHNNFIKTSGFDYF